MLDQVKNPTLIYITVLTSLLLASTPDINPWSSKDLEVHAGKVSRHQPLYVYHCQIHVCPPYQSQMLPAIKPTV